MLTCKIPRSILALSSFFCSQLARQTATNSVISKKIIIRKPELISRAIAFRCKITLCILPVAPVAAKHSTSLRVSFTGAGIYSAISHERGSRVTPTSYNHSDSGLSSMLAVHLYFYAYSLSLSNLRSRFFVQTLLLTITNATCVHIFQRLSKRPFLSITYHEPLQIGSLLFHTVLDSVRQTRSFYIGCYTIRFGCPRVQELLSEASVD